MLLRKKVQIYGVVLVLLAAAGWGLSGVCAQYLFTFHGIDASWLITVRQVFAGLAFLLFLALRGENIFVVFRQREDVKDILAFSFLGLLGAQFGIYYTIYLSNAATATVLQYTAPVFVVTWLAYKNKAWPAKRELFSMLLALVGVFLISTHGQLDAVVISPLALTIGLISGVSLAFYTVMPFRLLKKFSTNLIIGWGQLLSGLFLCFFVNPFNVPGHWDTGAVLSMLYIMIGGTLAAYSLFLVGLRIVGATKASLISCSEPLVSIIAVVVWLHTPLTGMDLLGMLCIIVTVVLLSFSKK